MAKYLRPLILLFAIIGIVCWKSPSYSEIKRNYPIWNRYYGTERVIYDDIGAIDSGKWAQLGPFRFSLPEWTYLFVSDYLLKNHSFFQLRSEALHSLLNKYDVDVRFLLVKEIKNESIEDFSARKLHELGVGNRSLGNRGVLVVLDDKNKQVRIEVSYNAEEYFTDAFVGAEQKIITPLFAEGKHQFTVTAVTETFAHRIRDAILGYQYEVTPDEVTPFSDHSSGGAGSTAKVTVNSQQISPEILERYNREFAAGRTPEEALQKHTKWTSGGLDIIDVGIHTEGTKQMYYQHRLPLPSDYLGKPHYDNTRPHVILEKGDLAVVIFTDNPFYSPDCYVKETDGWKTDLIATWGFSVQHINIQPANSPFSWYLPCRDRCTDFYYQQYGSSFRKYLKTFRNDLISIGGGYYRFKIGDNRMILTRYAKEHSPAYDNPNCDIRENLKNPVSKLEPLLNEDSDPGRTIDNLKVLGTIENRGLSSEQLLEKYLFHEEHLKSKYLARIRYEIMKLYRDKFNDCAKAEEWYEKYLRTPQEVADLPVESIKFLRIRNWGDKIIEEY